MACKNVCKLCNKLILSQSVTFAAATGLVINIPEGNYVNGEKYCIVVAQALPATTTVNANVYITIGDSTTLYPLNKCDCAQASACFIRTRTKYSTVVRTTPNGGSFNMLGKVCCSGVDALPSISG